jgi:hypothetical protein
MRKMLLAAVAVLSLTGALALVANASSDGELSGATRMQQTGAYGGDGGGGWTRFTCEVHRTAGMASSRPSPDAGRD